MPVAEVGRGAEAGDEPDHEEDHDDRSDDLRQPDERPDAAHGQQPELPQGHPLGLHGLGLDLGLDRLPLAVGLRRVVLGLVARSTQPLDLRAERRPGEVAVGREQQRRDSGEDHAGRRRDGHQTQDQQHSDGPSRQADEPAVRGGIGQKSLLTQEPGHPPRFCRFDS